MESKGTRKVFHAGRAEYAALKQLGEAFVMRMMTRRQLLARAFLVLIVLLLTAVGYYWTEIARVYHVIRLFERDLIVGNFRAMDAMFQTTSVRRADRPHEFVLVPRDLPRSYQYKGESKDLARFLEETGTTGLVVLRDGAISYEQYFRGQSAQSKTISWSVAKSFISALVGIAVAEGRIRDIGDPISNYVPRLRGSGYDGVPIKRVLQMASGIRFNEDYGDFWSDINRLGRAIAFNTSLDEFVASLEREYEPGSCHHYVSMDTQALGMLLRAATGEALASYLESRIWRRIGMESDAYWLIDRDGMELAFGGLNAVLRDYARFGQLVLNEGAWNGEQVVPREWFRAGTVHSAPRECPRHTPSLGLGYGYQWWVPPGEGDYLAIGVYNQFVYVHPRHRVVIAKSSAYPDYNRDGTDKELESIAIFRAIAAHVARQ